MGATMFAECQEEAGDHGASARPSHLCVICASLLQGSSVGSCFNGLFSPNQLRLMHHQDLSKHTCTTCLSLRRGKSVVIVLCLIPKLAWFGTIIPNNLKSLLIDCGCKEFCTCMHIVCVRGTQGPGRYRGRAGRCVLPPLSALGCHSVVWCPLSGCSHAKDHTKNTHFFSTRQPPQSRTEQSRHKTVPALKPPVH